MIKHTSLFLILSMSYAASFSLGQYEYVHDAYNKGDFSKAQRIMESMLVDDPFDTQKVYDAGVISYRKGEYQQAYDYFTHAEQKSSHPSDLHRKALFNKANSQVLLNQLEQAIATYDDLLAVYTDDEKAQHNKKVVEQMLEEKKQNEKSSQDQPDKNQNQDKQNSDSNKQPEHNNDQNKDQSAKDDQSKSANEQQSNKKPDNNPQDSGNDQQPDAHDDAEQQQQGDSQKQNGADQQDDANGSDQPAGADQSGSQPQDAPGNEQQKTEPQQSSQTGNQQAAEQDNSAGSQQDETLDAALAHYMQQHDMRDAQLNKQLIQYMVGQQKKRGNDAPEW